MVERWFTPLVEQGQSLDRSLAELRYSLKDTPPYWSVPVLYLATNDAVLFPNEAQYARGEYIRRMRQHCRQFARTFEGSRMNELTPRTYQQQMVAEVKARGPTPQGSRDWEVGPRREFLDVLRLHRTIIVIGRAGRGKTSLLYGAVLTQLDALERDEKEVVPVYVRLKELQEAKSLEAYFHEQCHDARLFSWLWGHLQRGNALVVLDGLDEVPREQWADLLSRNGMLATLVDFCSTPRARLVLTCRDSVYAEVSKLLMELMAAGPTESVMTMLLRPLTRDQRLAYVRQFFGDEQKTQRFLKDITLPQRSHSDRYDLAHEPLYLHMLCWLHEGNGVAFQLPAAEDELWHQVVVQLLKQRRVISEREAQDHLRLLEELAFHARFCGKPLTYTFAENTATWLAADKQFGSPRDKAQEWLEELEYWDLLRRRDTEADGLYEFPIPMLDEYFAARHIAERWREKDKRYRHWFPRGSIWHWSRKSRLCPNPECLTPVLPFRTLLRHADHEEMFLLMVGLLTVPERERLFLKSIRGAANLTPSDIPFFVAILRELLTSDPSQLPDESRKMDLQEGTCDKTSLAP